MSRTENLIVPLPALDRAMLDSLAEAQGEGEPDLIVELIDLYLQDTPPRVCIMREALANGDKLRLERAAHSLKGSSSTLGAVQVAESCRELEAFARGASFTEAQMVLDRMDGELSLLGDAFQIQRERRVAMMQ